MVLWVGVPAEGCLGCVRARVLLYGLLWLLKEGCMGVREEGKRRSKSIETCEQGMKSRKEGVDGRDGEMLFQKGRRTWEKERNRITEVCKQMEGKVKVFVMEWKRGTEWGTLGRIERKCEVWIKGEWEGWRGGVRVQD